MIEAFERHLTAIDIGKKFNNAKTNQDKIDVCKEFLEKQGYEVNLKPTKVEFDKGEPFVNHLGQKTWTSNGTSMPPFIDNTAIVLKSSIKISDKEIQRRGSQIATDQVYQSELLYEMIPELAKYMKTTLMPFDHYENSYTLITKLGVFKV